MKGTLKLAKKNRNRNKMKNEDSESKVKHIFLSVNQASEMAWAPNFLQ